MAAENPTAPSGAHGSNADNTSSDLEEMAAAATVKFAELRRNVEAAAREWGIHPHHVEGKFVAALLGTLGWLAQLHEAGMQRLEAVASERAAVAKMQLDAAVELRRGAEAALHQARTAMIQEEVIRETLVVRMIEQTFPMFAERLQKCLFIKEWVVNTGIRQRRFYLNAGIAVAVILGSYVAGRLDQPGPSRAEAIGTYCDAKAFLSGGHFYCLMDDFRPKSQ